jgi:hypothetical protein
MGEISSSVSVTSPIQNVLLNSQIKYETTQMHRSAANSVFLPANSVFLPAVFIFIKQSRPFPLNIDLYVDL